MQDARGNLVDWHLQRLRSELGITRTVTAETTPTELAREINRHEGFKAVSWGRHGRRRVYIRRFRCVSVERGIDESVEPEYTHFILFPRVMASPWIESNREDFHWQTPIIEPLLTVKEADMQKGPQFESMMVAEAIARIRIDIATLTAPSASIRRSIEFLRHQ